MTSRKPISEADLELLQRKSFSYFLHETNPDNGLVIDKTEADWPASIAATGFALAAYPVAVQRGFMPRTAAVERTLTTLRFFGTARKDQNPTPLATRVFIIIFSICHRRGIDGGKYGDRGNQCALVDNKMITILITYTIKEMRGTHEQETAIFN